MLIFILLDDFKMYAQSVVGLKTGYVNNAIYYPINTHNSF